jgi:hypothetical protein
MHNQGHLTLRVSTIRRMFCPRTFQSNSLKLERDPDLLKDFLHGQRLKLLTFNFKTIFRCGQRLSSLMSLQRQIFTTASMILWQTYFISQQNSAQVLKVFIISEPFINRDLE